MVDVPLAPVHEASQPRPIPKPANALEITPPSAALLPSSSASRIRDSHLNLEAFSPVNQNGSYEFDRVLKSGYVHKRTRKTKVPKLELYVCMMAALLITDTGLETNLSCPTTK